MKKVIAIFTLVVMGLTLFAGCQKPRDPNVLYEDMLSEELKEEINNLLFKKFVAKIYWDNIDPYYGDSYYGTINDCIILWGGKGGFDFGESIPIYHFEVAGYTFEGKGAFNFYVYRNGEVCKLKEAYEKNWLTKEQIGKIHTKHNVGYAKEMKLQEEMNAPFLEESYADYEEYRRHFLYNERLSETQKEELYNALLTQYNVAVDWDYAYTFYGTINGCAILMTVDHGIAHSYCSMAIGSCTFEWQDVFELFAYRDGTACRLQEAYEKGWLTHFNIEQIRAKNVQYYAALYTETHASGE